MIPPILLIGIAGAAAAFLFAGGEKDAHAAPEGGGGVPSKPKAKAKPKPVPTPKGAKQEPKPAGTMPPASVLGRIVAATASGDPDKMRAEAAQLKHEGWTVQAASLEAAANDLEKAQKATGTAPILPPAVIPNQNPGVTPPAAGGQPSLTLPPIPSVSVTLPDNTVITTGSKPKPPRPHTRPASAGGSSGTKAGANLAIDLQRHLTTHPIWKEDHALVKRFQVQEGLTADGLYGPLTAKAAAKYDLVPVRPYYWPKATATAAKADWKTYALAQAMRDPSRSEEWKGVA